MRIWVDRKKRRNGTYSELERLHKSEGFVDRAAHGEVVHRDLAKMRSLLLESSMTKLSK